MQQKQRRLSQLKWITGAALLLAGVAGVQAASFDCAKASAKVEKAICGDAELSRLDERMAEAYKKQLAAAGDKVEYVRYDQREFVKELRSAHEGETEDQMDCAKAYAACVRRMMSERIGVLENTAYAAGGVFENKIAKLLIRPRADGAVDVLLFYRADSTIRSTLKEQTPKGDRVTPGAVTLNLPEEIVSRMGMGALGEADRENCEARVRFTGRDALVVTNGKCGARFPGKYQRNLKDRVDNYRQEID
ncbi:MAG TPA: hypothetical protein VGN52_06655 [Burkholderiales bacterium]|jgi:uncharacterized protein YecT (DUF1311 family)